MAKNAYQKSDNRLYVVIAVAGGDCTVIGEKNYFVNAKTYKTNLWTEKLNNTGGMEWNKTILTCTAGDIAFNGLQKAYHDGYIIVGNKNNKELMINLK